MKNELTLFTIPSCHHCNSLKKRLDELNIPYFNFDVIENRVDWMVIVDKIGIDILPTIYIKEINSDVGVYYIPGNHFQSEDEIVDILKKIF